MAKAKVTDLRKAYPDLIDKTSRMYQPEVRRPMGVLEWPAMRRLADRLDPSYKN